MVAKHQPPKTDILWEGKTPSGTIGDPPGMLDLFRVLLPALAALFHERHDLVVENLLLRHAAGSKSRSALARGRTSSAKDRFFWLVVRRLYPTWRRHLVPALAGWAGMTASNLIHDRDRVGCRPRRAHLRARHSRGEGE